MRWIVIADSTCCRIYQTDKRLTDITLLIEMNHPENRLKRSESITTDRPGHYNTYNSARGAYSPRTDPKDALVDRFALEIANVLNQGRNNHLYDKLIIVMDPHMSGLVYRHLDKHIKEYIFHEIRKDMIHTRNDKLLKFLRLQTQKR